MMHIHVWKRVNLSDYHIHAYYECRCGKRKVRRRNRRMQQPVARCWLDGGDWPCDDLRQPIQRS